MGGRQARRLTLASLAVTLAGTVVAAAQPSSALMAMATNVLGRVVQITVAGGSTGYGFVVGEHVDAAGRPVFLIVTADHVVRDQNAQGDQPAPPQVTYCADPTHGWQASLLGFRMRRPQAISPDRRRRYRRAYRSGPP